MIPTNWDRRIVDLVHEYPVETVYGALDRDPIGGLKASVALPRVSRDGLEEHVSVIRDAGATFTYLINTSCLGNREYTPGGFSRIQDFLRYLVDIGVDQVVVGIPYLLELVRANAPELKVRVSTIAMVDSVQKARFWEDLGAHEILLDQHVNRRFDRIAAIRRAVDCELSVMVNDFCLLQCPMTQYHSNALGHTSHLDDTPMVDTSALTCKTQMLRRPVDMIRAPWIRPEDLGRYEELGIDGFKLAGRTQTTEVIAFQVAAYAARRFDGNLLDLLEIVRLKADEDQQRLLDRLLDRAPRITQLAMKAGAAVLARARVSNRANQLRYAAGQPAERARRSIAAFHALGEAYANVHIDNRALDGFLDGFENLGCESCDECTYCQRFTDEALTTDDDRISHAGGLVDDLLDALKRGSI